MLEKLKNTTIVLTGAAHGLGQELAHQLHKAGAKLVLLDIDQDSLKKTASLLGATDFICDIRDVNQVQNIVAQITQNPVDILINCAGVWTDDELEKSNVDLRKNALEVNALGQINVTEAFLPYFKNKKDGIIVNVISTSGATEIPAGDNQRWKTYGASKWAFVGYTNALRKDIENTKIKLIQFYPGGFDSNLYEAAGRDNPHAQSWMMDVKDVAEILLFALTRPKDVWMEKIVVSKFME